MRPRHGFRSWCWRSKGTVRRWYFVGTAIGATQLPSIHSDPADRLLVGVAMESQLVLLSPDPIIRRYPGLQVLW